MRTLFALAAAGTAAATVDQFSTWAAKHGKSYLSKEETVMRRRIFAANVQKVKAHNAAGHSWKMAVNKFADMTPEEFKATMAGGLRGRRADDSHVDYSLGKTKVSALPASVDWVGKGAVTPVKNQGQCGSCWSFSTTGSTEGAMYISTGTLPSLSEQQLVDCSQAEGNQGCNGGLMDQAFQYYIKHGAACTEASYPYTAVDGKCAAHNCTNGASITNYTDVAPNSDTALMTAIAQQPVSIAVEADQDSFQLYSTGVMTAACGTNLDHGVLAVGYGTMSAGGDYYTVKNSWGADWGMQGYILLGRGSSYNNGAGQCGILMQPSFPTGATAAGPINDDSTGGGGTTTTGGGGGTTTTSGGGGSTTTTGGGSTTGTGGSTSAAVRKGKAINAAGHRA